MHGVKLTNKSKKEEHAHAIASFEKMQLREQEQVRVGRISPHPLLDVPSIQLFVHITFQMVDMKQKLVEVVVQERLAKDLFNNLERALADAEAYQNDQVPALCRRTLILDEY